MIKGSVSITDTDTGMAALLKRFRQPSNTVEVGVHPDEEQTLLVIAGANEFGATIKHPGGTPYVVGKNGKAKFVPISRGGAVAGFTKPHTIVIPARSYIRSTVDRNQEKYDNLLNQLLGRVIDGNLEGFDALQILGMKVEADIKRTMVTMRTPPNAPSTIRKKKGEDNPLIDHGTLLGSIRYEVQ